MDPTNTQVTTPSTPSSFRSPSVPTPQVFTPPPTNGDNRTKKLLLAGGGVIMLLVGLGSAILLIRQQQLVQTDAWDCGNYTFSVSQTGTVRAINNSTRSEPLQRAEVLIDSVAVDTLDVPALAPGQSQDIGQVNVPPSGAFLWEVRGTADCTASGNYAALSARCVNIEAYDESWNKLTATDMASLKSGDTVRFAVTGSATSGDFTKARLTINNILQPETLLKRPTSNDYYQEYIIPVGTSSFNVKAELFHASLNRWF